MKKIAIVLLNYNKEELTHQCLQTLKSLEIGDFSICIIIVDNASRKIFALGKNEEKENIIVIRNEINKGYSGGNNTGIVYALDNGFDYIMLLNNDTLVHKNLVTALFDAFEKNPYIGCASPKIYFAPGHEFHKERYKKDEIGKVFWYAGGIVDWNNMYNSHRGVDEVDKGQYDIMQETDFATGCCFFVRKEALQKVGMLDDSYFLYLEDADLNQRIKRAGYKIYYIPQGKLWHINAGSTGGSGSTLQEYFQTRNRMLFGMRYAPMRTKFALIRESFRFFLYGREWQKKAIKDFYLRKFGKGSYPIQ